MKEKLKKQKGITLIALIISIIVMLILAAVSINIIMNQGIITKSQDAANTHNKAAEKEAIELAYSKYLTEKYNGETQTLTIADSSATVTGNEESGWTITYANGNVYKLSKNGGIEGPTKKSEDEIAVEKYALGEDLKGQKLKNLLSNPEEVSFKQLNGKDVQPIYEMFDKIENQTYNFSLFIEYNNKIYKIVLTETDLENYDVSEYITRSVSFIYEPKGREGQKLEYSYDGTEENKKEWTILYDYGDSVEIISPEPIGNLTLGYDDTQAQGNNNFEKAVYSYNHAIDRINNYAENLVTNTNKKSVRGLGSNPENPSYRNTEKYRSTFNYKYNNEAVIIDGMIEKGDTNCEQDMVRMSYYGLTEMDMYWIASRVMFDLGEGNMDCGIRNMGASGDYATGVSIEPEGKISGSSTVTNGVSVGSYSSAVVPIVKINYPSN